MQCWNMCLFTLCTDYLSFFDSVGVGAVAALAGGVVELGCEAGAGDALAGGTTRLAELPRVFGLFKARQYTQTNSGNELVRGGITQSRS